MASNPESAGRDRQEVDVSYEQERVYAQLTLETRLSWEDIWVTYSISDSDVRAVLAGCSGAVAPGEGLAIVGPSGSGKSTLLRVLAGLQTPDAGRVLIGSTAVDHTRSQLDSRVALIFQDARLVGFLSVEENLRLSAEYRNQPIDDEAVDVVLARIGLSGFGKRIPKTLSGGERQRVAIARALVSGASVILADEPTGALDRANSDQVAGLLADVAAQGLAVVVVTHDAKVAAEFSASISLGGQ